MPIFRIRLTKEEGQKWHVVLRTDLYVEAPDKESAERTLDKVLEYRCVEELTKERVTWDEQSAEKFDSSPTHLEEIEDCEEVDPGDSLVPKIDWSSLTSLLED